MQKQSFLPCVNRRSFLKGSACVAAGLLLPETHFTGGVRKPNGNADWRYYGADPATTRYSPLDQINRGNVRDLRIAWTYHTGDLLGRSRTTMECTPIAVDGVMYVTSPLLKVCALDAVSGRLI